MNGTGGNVIGTRWMIEKMFLSPSSFQKCWLFWRSFMRALAERDRVAPDVQRRASGSRSCVEESIGA